MNCTLSLLHQTIHAFWIQSPENISMSPLSIIFHIIFISYFLTTKNPQKPPPIHGKKKQEKKRQRSFLSSSMYKDLPAFIIMAVYVQNSATKTTCIQVSTLGYSHRNSGPWIEQSTASFPTPSTGSTFSYFSGYSDQNPLPSWQYFSLFFFYILLPVFDEYSTHKIPEPFWVELWINSWDWWRVNLKGLVSMLQFLADIVILQNVNNPKI